MNTWRAGCGGSRTSGSEGGPEKPTSREAGRALRSDPYAPVGDDVSGHLGGPAITGTYTGDPPPGLMSRGAFLGFQSLNRKVCGDVDADVPVRASCRW
jgi:hypothetical protein